MTCKCSPIEMCDYCMIEPHCECYYDENGERVYCEECMYDDEEGSL